MAMTCLCGLQQYFLGKERNRWRAVRRHRITGIKRKRVIWKT